MVEEQSITDAIRNVEAKLKLMNSKRSQYLSQGQRKRRAIP